MLSKTFPSVKGIATEGAKNCITILNSSSKYSGVYYDVEEIRVQRFMFIPMTQSDLQIVCGRYKILKHCLFIT